MVLYYDNIFIKEIKYVNKFEKIIMECVVWKQKVFC